MVRLFIASLLLYCFMAVIQGSADANVVKEEDSTKTLALWKKANSIESDLMQASRSIVSGAGSEMTATRMREAVQVVECLHRLSSVTSDLESVLHIDTMALFTSKEMKDRRDELVTLDVVRTSLSDTLTHVPVERQIVNSIVGDCRNSVLVNTKAQAVLDLIEEIDTTVAPIAKRLAEEVL